MGLNDYEVEHFDGARDEGRRWVSWGYARSRQVTARAHCVNLSKRYPDVMFRLVHNRSTVAAPVTMSYILAGLEQPPAFVLGADEKTDGFLVGEVRTFETGRRFAYTIDWLRNGEFVPMPNSAIYGNLASIAAGFKSPGLYRVMSPAGEFESYISDGKFITAEAAQAYLDAIADRVKAVNTWIVPPGKLAGELNLLRSAVQSDNLAGIAAILVGLADELCSLALDGNVTDAQRIALRVAADRVDSAAHVMTHPTVTKPGLKNQM